MADRCRSCDAPIEWAPTTRGSRMPLDPGYHQDGTIAIGPDGIAHTTDTRPARRTHFATCDDPDRFRRTKTRQ